jgi:Mg2+ and Co2+ transporter CorA
MMSFLTYITGFFMNFELLPILKAHHYAYTVQIWALSGLK